MKVYFREFSDGDCELAVLEPSNDGHVIMDVGNFAYSSWLKNWWDGTTVEKFLSEWTYIGEL